MGHYWRTSLAVGVDPCMAFAQMIHETSAYDDTLSLWRPMQSWWAARPRRNPAGIGVTGRVLPQDAAVPGDGWEWRPERARWEQGVSFPSWKDSVRAHIGRLLAYAVRPGRETPVQQLIAEALGWRALPAKLRGTAPRLVQLGAQINPTGEGWAYPGRDYGEHIADIATRIQESTTAA